MSREGMKVLFGMPLRQTTGFVQSMLRLVGPDWAVPDFGTLCRRQRTLNVSLPYRGGTGPLNLLTDSTGNKAPLGSILRMRLPGDGWRGYHRRSRVETKMHCVKLLGKISWRGTSTGRSRKSKSAPPSSTAIPLLAYPSLRS
jgi:DDE family transposase